MRILIYIGLSLVLMGLSFMIYMIQDSIYHTPRDTGFYFFQDIAFLPVQILLGVLIIDNIVNYREKKKLLQKMNMVIGVFFCEAGTELLKYFVRVSNPSDSALRELLTIKPSWDEKTFLKTATSAAQYNYNIDIDASFLDELKMYLAARNENILRLLENPNLMEHDRFTDLLWAVSHLSEELYHRKGFDHLSHTDAEHVKGDILRAYRLLVSEWFIYLAHLKKQYPYLYSLSIRTNPFNPEAKVEIA